VVANAGQCIRPGPLGSVGQLLEGMKARKDLELSVGDDSKEACRHL